MSVNTTEPSIKAPEGYDTVNRSTGETVMHITPDNNGNAIIEVKTGKGKESSNQSTVYNACQAGTAIGCGEKAKSAGNDGTQAPTAVYTTTPKE
ncbi:MAG: hypothetical protein P1U70_27370 [Saprospiraceae bacterium]|nr:hypothetical protein [Saprospiraceae bacterium]